MPKFTVYFQPIADLTVAVEADDFDEALDLAYEERPTDVCGQCAGAWPGQAHSLDLGMDGAEAYLVTDDNGDKVWESKSYIEGLNDTISSLRKRVDELEAQQKKTS
jgi:hypothetical protein